MASDVLIAGLGNWLMRDDGVGVHAVRALEADPPPGTTLLEVGTAVLDFLDELEAAAVVIALDAIGGGDAPGTIYRQDPAAVAPRGPERSSHELDLFAALAMLEEARRPRVIAIGVEPARVEYGIELSEAVLAAFPDYLQVIRDTAAAAVEERARLRR